VTASAAAATRAPRAARAALLVVSNASKTPLQAEIGLNAVALGFGDAP